MNILLVANYSRERQQSMLHFAEAMERGLTEAGHTVRVLRPPVVLGRLWRRPGVVSKWLGYADKYVLFPFRLKRDARSADIVHVCDHSDSLYTRYLQDVPHLVTCHDLLAVRSAFNEFPEHPTRWSGRQYQKMIVAGINRARHLVCVSEATMQDAARLTTCRNGRLALVPNGLNYPYRPMAREAAAPRLARLGVDATCQYFLHVGSNVWYKNRIGVLKIFHELRRHASGRDLLLVTAGQPWSDDMRRFIAEHGLAGKVVEIKLPGDEDLRALYSAAKGLLFPSLQEGFGWPIIEAQACGCPVVTSDRLPMTDVAGDAAIFIHPEDPASSARTIAERMAELPQLREAGFRNAQRFSTKAMVDGYVGVYSVVSAQRQTTHAAALGSVRAGT